MKPDWDSLAEEFKSSATVVVADVDCTGAGEPLCSRFNVEGFPTIKSFSPPDTEGEDYEGGRDLADLREFAKGLGPGCSMATKDKCSPEELTELEELSKRSPTELQAELDEMDAKLKAASEAHDELLKSLQAQYEASEASVGELKKELKPKMKKLRAAMADPAVAAPTKDEV
jgi:protein disulfide-isomerase A6